MKVLNLPGVAKKKNMDSNSMTDGQRIRPFGAAKQQDPRPRAERRFLLPPPRNNLPRHEKGPPERAFLLRADAGSAEDIAGDIVEPAVGVLHLACTI